MKMGDGKIISEDGDKYYSSSEWKDAFNHCDVKANKRALNIYIYDAFDSAGSSLATTGRGYSNRGSNFQPFILLDYERLNQDYDGEKVQMPASHEVGHSFTLGHICDLKASGKSKNSNLMASSGTIDITSDYSVYKGNNGISYDCPKSGGNRSLGLSAEQSIIVLEAIVKQMDFWLEPSY